MIGVNMAPGPQIRPQKGKRVGDGQQMDGWMLCLVQRMGHRDLLGRTRVVGCCFLKLEGSLAPEHPREGTGGRASGCRNWEPVTLELAALSHHQVLSLRVRTGLGVGGRWERRAVGQGVRVVSRRTVSARVGTVRLPGSGEQRT